MLKKIQWEAYSSLSRNEAIQKIKDAILNHQGCILNFNMFSDLAISMSIEIEARHVPELHTALSSLLNISDFESGSFNTSSKQEWVIFMNVSFTQGKGNLKIEIPDVPG